MGVCLQNPHKKWNFQKKRRNHLGLFFLQGYKKFGNSAILVFLAAPGTRFSCCIAPCLRTSRPYCMTIWHALIGMVEILEVVGKISKEYHHDSSTGASSAQNLIEAHQKWSDIGCFHIKRLLSPPFFGGGIWNF